jgi:hypothetical protein
MTWTRALVYVTAWLLLTVLYVATERPPPTTARSPGEPPRAHSPFGLTTGEVSEMRLEAGGRRVDAVRAEGRWRVREPAGAAVPPDLISAVVSAILDSEHAEVVRLPEGRAEEFGLLEPRARIVLTRADGRSVGVALGTRNPAQTAVYARSDRSPNVVLLGVNVLYYIDLAMKAAGETRHATPGVAGGGKGTGRS